MLKYILHSGRQMGSGRRRAHQLASCLEALMRPVSDALPRGYNKRWTSTDFRGGPYRPVNIQLEFPVGNEREVCENPLHLPAKTCSARLAHIPPQIGLMLLPVGQLYLPVSAGLMAIGDP